MVKSKLDYIRTRDFMQFDCKNIKRIGGQSNYIKHAPSPLYRIDGSWFICLDGDLAPAKNNCTVLSFGISSDYTFDQHINKEYGCRTFSFDPNVEAKLFADIRASKIELRDAVRIDVNRTWSFYKIGISNKRFNKSFYYVNKGDLVDLATILKLTHMENKTIDVFKMDIEGHEKGIFVDLNMDYACKYFKQIVLETHKNTFRFKDLEKLEECFLMFRRDTRFFESFVYSNNLGHLSEFQVPDLFNMKLKNYFNETFLAEFMFVTGEIYFANRNFLPNTENQI